MSRSTTRTPRSRRRNVTTSSRGCSRRKVLRPEAQRLEAAIDAAVGVMRSPAGDVLKEPNRAYTAVSAEIEPMVRATRDANEIARLDFDGEHRPAVSRVDVEEPAAFDNQPHFVLVVPVFRAELREHR